MTKSVLVTGFSPFPGTPVNPTAELIERLRLRLPHHAQRVRFTYARLPTTWAARSTVAERLRRETKPEAIVHFGVDGSRPQINVETRAVNRATQLRPDADGAFAEAVTLSDDPCPYRHATLDPRPLVQAISSLGLPARISRDAGTYLCNATLWDSLGGDVPAIFIHVPTLTKPGRNDGRLSIGDLERAAIACLRQIATRL